MSYRIVTDSSSNIYDMEGVNYGSAAFHISIGGTEFLDNAGTDLAVFNDCMVRALDAGKPCGTACPSPDEWLKSFGTDDEIYCITISKNLSGSFNSAVAAGSLYEEQHPGKKVYVLDSLSTAGTMLLMRDYLIGFLECGITGNEAVKRVEDYRREHTDILYTLQSMKRLAAGGRVNPLLIKAIGVLDLRIIGTASPEGTIVLKSKHRGAAKVLKGTFDLMLKCGYHGGKAYICHNMNEPDALALKSMILDHFGQDTFVDICRTRVLCSYYAEKYGYIVGFEK